VAKYTQAVAARKKNEKEIAERKRRTAMTDRLRDRNDRFLCDVTVPDFNVLFASGFGNDMVKAYTDDVMQASGLDLD
jgi:hypothetical protein